MKGPAFLLKIADEATPPQYRTLAGLRATAMRVSREVTAVKADGILLGETAARILTEHALTSAIGNFELSFEDGNKMRGPFIIGRLDCTGIFNDVPSYCIELESQGEVIQS